MFTSSSDIQKVSSRCCVFLSLTLLVMYLFLYVNHDANLSVGWIVFGTGLFFYDMILGLTNLYVKRKLWIFLRYVELCVISFVFNIQDLMPFGAFHLMLMISLLIQIVFTFDYSDVYTRIVSLSTGVIPPIFILLIRLLIMTNDMLPILERAGILMCMTLLVAAVTNGISKEVNSLEQKYYEQRRLVDSAKYINEELKQHQEKVKHANEELGVQKIKLESAYNRINSANTQMILQNEILKAITSVLEADKLLQIMCQALKNDLMLSCCAIVLHKNVMENDNTICAIESLFSEDVQEMMRQQISDGILTQYEAYRNGYVDNHVNTKEYDFLAERNIGSLLIMPMIRNNVMIGALLCTHAKYDFFTENRVFFDTIMAQFMIALDNAFLYAKMQNMAVRDGLTGIYNRRHLNLKMEDFSKAAVQRQEPLSVALFDIDHFKHVNDTYGHLFGDLVIKNIADIANEMAKKYNGFAARYGGEEFVLVFPGKDEEICCRIVEEMRKRIHELQLEYDGIYVGVNVSVGVTGYPGCCKTPNSLLEHADWAMYYSKKHGRNQVTMDSEQMRKQLGLMDKRE